MILTLTLFEAIQVINSRNGICPQMNLNIIKLRYWRLDLDLYYWQLKNKNECYCHINFPTLKEFVNAMVLTEYLFQIRIENTLPFSKILGPLITLFIPILLGTLCENNIP